MHSEKQLDGGIWIDLFDPSDSEREDVRRAHGLRVPGRQELEEIESSSRLSRDGSTLYLNMPIPTMDADGMLVPSPMGFILSETVLVTIRFAALESLAAVPAKLDKQSISPPGVFAMIIEDMVDHAADRLEKIAADLAAISRALFGRVQATPHNIKRQTQMLKRMLFAIGFAGDQLSHIRESLLGLQRILAYTLEVCHAWKPEDFLARLNIARRDLQSLVEHETHLSDKTQFLLDANLGFINTEQNDIFKVLTIVSVVGIPPTLIASMYGMNFHYMPELSWSFGYGYGLGLIALSTILPILWFKWRGWW
ncbi:MAG: magnesium transporter CorA family protein [Alphaproteobacteria bacterium]|nr:magnesium transporter CorA family protein [Alphaproteobacteria bacterium]MBV9693946.1 magnesium transporter CorA family protein [Alphaproteobacteria bacterium]